ncbi:hypothetical protein EV182_006708, partial [Spiromyces aspiralis]
LIHAWYLICKYSDDQYQVLVDDENNSHSHVVVITAGLPPQSPAQDLGTAGPMGNNAGYHTGYYPAPYIHGQQQPQSQPQPQQQQYNGHYPAHTQFQAYTQVQQQPGYPEDSSKPPYPPPSYDSISK